jgi:hypothetical protein
LDRVDDRKALLKYARRARARMAFARGLEWVFRGLFWACVVALVAVLVHKLFGWALPVVPGLAGLGVAVLLTGLFGALFPRLSVGEAAAEVDRRAGWKERLSSALALPSVTHPMEAALVQDVHGMLGKRTPSELLPLRAPRELKWIPVAAAVLAAAAWLLPSFDLIGVLAEARKKEDEKKQVAVALQKLQEKRKELEKADLNNEAVKKALQKMDEAAKELEKTPPSDPKQAMAQIQQLSDDLKKLKNEMGRSLAMAEKIQQQLAKDSADTGELGKLLKSGNFEAAAQALAKARAALDSGQMTPEQKEKLKKQLEALKDKLGKEKDLEELEKKLSKAMEGLDQNKEKMLDDLQQELSDLGDDLSDAEALADALKDLEDLSDALAKGKGQCPSCGKKKDQDGEGG